MIRGWHSVGSVFIIGVAVICAAGVMKSAAPDQGTEVQTASQNWPQATGDLGNTRYSTLSQINTETVKNLGAAWISDKFDDSGSSRVTPVVVDGLMFVTAGAKVYALDAKSGKTVWKYETSGIQLGVTGMGNQGRGGRGVPNSQGVGTGDGKVFIGLTDAQMIALDQKTGKLIWRCNVGDVKPNERGGISATPVFVNGVVYTSVAFGEGRYIGEAIALDASDGHQLWRWMAIPGPGEPGHETWTNDPKNDTWKMGGADVWQPPVIDTGLGLVYYGTGNPSPNRVGNVRPGNNLYSCAIVALDMKTGKLRWYFQFAHHDLWENDLAVPPVLYDAQVGGGAPRKAIAVIRPDGTLFQLDRATGKPIWPVEERPVRQSELYKTAPTQPYLKGIQNSSLIHNCPHWKAPEGFIYRCEFFQPPTDDPPNVLVPGPGMRSAPMSFDPKSGYFFIQGEDRAEWEWNSPRPSTWEWPSGYMTQRVPGLDNQAINIFEALDPKTYKIVWRKEFRLPTSHYGVGGFLSTAGGLTFHRLEDGNLVAYEGKTGNELWKFQTGVAGTNTANAMTYEVDGQQYIGVIEDSQVWGFRLGGDIPQRPDPPLPPLEENRALEGPIREAQLIRMAAPDDYDYRNDINPMKDRVKAGSQVTFLNDGSETHTFVAMDGSWTTGSLLPRQTAILTFDKPGSYLYHCKEHPWSYGLIIVTPADGQASAAAGASPPPAGR